MGIQSEYKILFKIFSCFQKTAKCDPYTGKKSRQPLRSLRYWQAKTFRVAIIICSKN